ncbi:MAG: hypothetical protein Q7J05_02600 [Paludibacter sp.]|nr:hypothetical protein [Paludibacter sp.]
MNLKSRVFNFINQNEGGVNIYEMEKPLGENRMKLGYVTKTLLEEGKIQKIDDKYYSIEVDDKTELKCFKRFSK